MGEEILITKLSDLLPRNIKDIQFAIVPNTEKVQKFTFKKVEMINLWDFFALKVSQLLINC